jgi:hypothetical protein
MISFVLQLELLHSSQEFREWTTRMYSFSEAIMIKRRLRKEQKLQRKL